MRHFVLKQQEIRLSKTARKLYWASAQRWLNASWEMAKLIAKHDSIPVSWINPDRFYQANLEYTDMFESFAEFGVTETEYNNYVKVYNAYADAEDAYERYIIRHLNDWLHSIE